VHQAVSIDGQDVSNAPLEQVSQLMRGPVGSTVSLDAPHL
jgi:C-terminal processing protease CtpA/Prc